MYALTAGTSIHTIRRMEYIIYSVGESTVGTRKAEGAASGERSSKMSLWGEQHLFGSRVSKEGLLLYSYDTLDDAESRTLASLRSSLCHDRRERFGSMHAERSSTTNVFTIMAIPLCLE